jgi:hypothetical protein
MTADQLKQITALRKQLHGTRYFCFERGATFLLYLKHDGDTKPTKVLGSADITTFCRKALVAAGVTK